MCGRCRVAGFAEIFKTDDELIAAPATTEVANANIAAKAFGNLAEQCVARVVPKRVIDRFEAIEIDKQCGQRCRLSLAATDCSCQLLGKQAAVRKTGQLIELRAFFKFIRSSPRFSNVPEGDNSANQFAIAIKQALAVDAQYDVRLLRHPINGDLIGELLACTRAHQWQISGIAITLAMLVDATKGLFPGWVRLHSRMQP